jgi:hypothetical protein
MPMDIKDDEPWSEMDIADLKNHVAQGATLEETATFLCRYCTPFQVAQKAKELFDRLLKSQFRIEQAVVRHSIKIQANPKRLFSPGSTGVRYHHIAGRGAHSPPGLGGNIEHSHEDGKQIPSPGGQPPGENRLEAKELGVIRQIGDRLVVEVDHFAKVDDRIGDLLVVAELPISDLHIGKIDAAERLELAAQRLRVVERRSDELVEVDVLDIERLSHMRAAGLQQPDDLRLVTRAVEPGLQRIRCRASRPLLSGVGAKLRTKVVAVRQNST